VEGNPGSKKMHFITDHQLKLTPSNNGRPALVRSMPAVCPPQLYDEYKPFEQPAEGMSTSPLTDSPPVPDA
jgi:hypothetical protein